MGVNEAKSVSLSDFGNTTLGCFEAPKYIETVSPVLCGSLSKLDV